MTYTQALKAVLDRLTALELLVQSMPSNPTPDLIEIDTRMQALQGALQAKISGG